jgi:hypothetical protein
MSGIYPPMSTGEIRSSNILRIGSSTLVELEEKVKALRTINLNVKKRRFIICREDIKLASGEVIIPKGSDIDISKVMLLKRHFKPEHQIKTFQPDEGIVLVSDMSTPVGIQFSMDLVTQVMNIGGGAYEAFIDRVDSFKEFAALYNKALFPKAGGRGLYSTAARTCQRRTGFLSADCPHRPLYPHA